MLMATAENPILNTPYAEPERHYATDIQGNLNYKDDRLYGFVSHPIAFKTGKRLAVRVVSQFGEESTKVLRF